MGLDFHINNSNTETPSWSYSGFGRFRIRLASVIDIDLDDMEGFAGHYSKTEKGDGKPWSEVKDAIVSLINHSDCDGHLTAKQCRNIAPRLREILNHAKFARSSEFPNSFDPTQDYDYINGMKLVACMEECARDNKRLIFS